MVLVAWVLLALLAAAVIILFLIRARRQVDFELERHPIAWIPLVAVCVLAVPPLLLILLVLSVVLYGVVVPICGVLSLLGFWRVHRTGPRARYLDRGLELYNQAGTLERLIEWPDIERVEEVYSPPVFHLPHLVLRDGERVPLYLVTSDELAPALERHGIPIEREFRD